MKGGNTLIREKIDKGEFHELISLRQGNLVQSVDFSSALVRDGFILGDFYIHLSSTVPSTNNDLVLLFPNNEKNKRHQVLYTKGYSDPCRLNKRLNKFFRQSSDKTDEFGDVKLAVSYGDHLIICKQITGTVYLLWAKYIVKANTNGHASVPQQNVPLIINFDGRASLKAVYILKKEITNDCDLDRLPVTDTSPVFTFDLRVPLFVCETRAEKDIPQQSVTKLHTMSEKDAEMAILAMAEGQFDNEVNAFEQSADREGEPDSGTPRSSVFRSDLYFPPSPFCE